MAASEEENLEGLMQALELEAPQPSDPSDQAPNPQPLSPSAPQPLRAPQPLSSSAPQVQHLDPSAPRISPDPQHPSTPPPQPPTQHPPKPSNGGGLGSRVTPEDSGPRSNAGEISAQEARTRGGGPARSGGDTEGNRSPMQRMLVTVKSSHLVYTFRQRVRRLPAIFAGNRERWKKAANKRELKSFIYRSQAEARFVFICHVISFSSLASILAAVSLNERFYDCHWSNIKVEDCSGLEPLRYVILFLSLVHLVFCIQLYKQRCSTVMAESPMRVKSTSWIGLVFEILTCFFVFPPQVKIDFHSPFGGTQEVYSIENWMTVLITSRLIVVLRSVREMIRIKDGGMIFVARVIKVRTWSLGFNFKYSMHINPVASLLIGFMFFILWLSYLTRLAELPVECFVDGLPEDCAHEVTPSNINHRYIRNTFWMVIVTVATVGYGDMVPDTFFGRVFIGFVILLGNIWTSLLLGIVVDKIQLSKPEKQMVDLVEHKVWRKELIHWASTWIQRWWKWHLAARKNAQAMAAKSPNHSESVKKVGISDAWKYSQHPDPSGAQPVFGAQENSNGLEASMIHLRNQFVPGIRAAHDKFTSLISNQRRRPTVDTTLHELRLSMSHVEEEMRDKFTRNEASVQKLESLLLQVIDKVSEQQKS